MIRVLDCSPPCVPHVAVHSLHSDQFPNIQRSLQGWTHSRSDSGLLTPADKHTASSRMSSRALIQNTFRISVPLPHVEESSAGVVIRQLVQ